MAVDWQALHREYPESGTWPQPKISAAYWDTNAWRTYFEGIKYSRTPPRSCPGCGGKPGLGPAGCCRKCYGATIGTRPKRRHAPQEEHDHGG